MTCGGFFSLLMMLWSSAVTAAEPIKVMLLDGASAAAYHNWKLTSQIMKRELEETGLFEVTQVSVPPADGDFSNIPSRTSPNIRWWCSITMRRTGRPPLKAAFRSLYEKRRRAGGGAWRRQCLSRLGGLQRNDRPGRLARPRRTGRPQMVLSERQTHIRTARRDPPACMANASRSASRRAQATIPSCAAAQAWMHRTDELYTACADPAKT
jgi:hypothetical protein